MPRQAPGEPSLEGYAELTLDQATFVRGRVAGFLSPLGLAKIPLQDLLCEAYVQGLNDTVALMNAKGLYLPEVQP